MSIFGLPLIMFGVDDITSSFMKVSLTTGVDMISPTPTLVLDYGTNVDSEGSDFTFTGGGIRTNFTGRVMIITNTQFQVIADTFDMHILQNTTIGGVVVVEGITGSLPILRANIAQRNGSINTTAIINATTNDIFSTRIGISSQLPHDTLRIFGNTTGIATSLTLIKF